MATEYRRIELLVTVKSYPLLSNRYGEAVCVAGIRTDTPEPEWVRLFPVQFRDLPFARRFKKYQVVALDATKHSTDQRPETVRPDRDTLRPGAMIDTKDGWQRRRELVDPLLIESMCKLKSLQAKHGTSLGAFRPGEVLDLIIEDGVGEWAENKAALAAQPTLDFQTKVELEKIPLSFKYRYRCSTAGCKGHTQSMIDWEIAQSYRAWRENYDESTLREKLREKFLDTMCAPSKDTIFFAGNQHLRPKGFMVLGVFWPPARLEVSEVEPR